MDSLRSPGHTRALMNNNTLKSKSNLPVPLHKRSQNCSVPCHNGWTNARLLLPNKILSNDVRKGGVVYVGWS